MIKLESAFFVFQGGKKGMNYLLLSKANKLFYGGVNEKGEPHCSNGVCIFQDGSYYQGEFSSGKIESKGKLTNV